VKFLCDNCKAKYQIADEKVAGKTVRMKCRKCGHQIEVRAAVTETSVASSPPKAAPEAPRPRMGGGLATSLSAAKPRAPAAPATASGALAGAFQRQVEQAPTTQPFGAGGGGSIEVSVTDEWYVAINGVPVGPVRISELRRKAAAGAVTEESLCWQEGLEEWRPIRSIPELAALVREAAQGNRVSLVGPPPERQSAPPRPPAPPQRPPAPSPFASSPLAPPTPPPGALPPAAAFASMTPQPPPPRPPAPMRSNVVPLHPAARAPAPPADIIDNIPGGTAPLASPLGLGAAALAVQPSLTPMPAPAAPPRPSIAADPFALPPAPTPTPLGVSPLMTSSPSMVPPYPTPDAGKRGVPLWFIAVLVVCLGFGSVAAYALFFRQPQQPQQIIVQVPTPTSPTVAKTDDTPPPAPDTSGVAPPGSATGTKITTGPRGGPRTGPTPPPGGGGAANLADLGLGGTGGTGPAPGPGGGGGGTAGGGLDQNAVQQVVRNRAPGVKRTCWERGGNDTKSSANVQVSVTVAPNGQVAGATATGDDPVIAKCIEGQVRTWSFPPPGQTTTVNIPFHFVRQ
jgi:predicted Zn finger-like uncharacterized protein